MKKHKCHFCGKGFSEKGNLKKHIAFIHEGVNHKCETCGKSYSTAGNLKVHKCIANEFFEEIKNDEPNIQGESSQSVQL